MSGIPIGGLLQGTYRVERLIGEGAMGAVYEASHLRLERRFAIKVLLAGAARDADAFARFAREAQVTSALGHPHIVEVIDFNETPDRAPYLVMELLDGEDLGARLERRGPLGLGEAASVVRQTALALQAAHDKGIVHRDLKPENVFLCRRAGRDDYVKVVDFGISKVLGAVTPLTNTHDFVGTPVYMSPEQIAHGAAHVDHRSDIYALGAMLYQMLAGRPPYGGDSLINVVYTIVNQPTPSLHDARPDVPAAFAAVVLRAMHKDPAQRFASMVDFWHALVAALASEDVDLAGLSTADPGSPPGPGRRLLPVETDEHEMALAAARAGSAAGAAAPAAPGPKLEHGPEIERARTTAGSTRRQALEASRTSTMQHGVGERHTVEPKHGSGRVAGAVLGAALVLGAGVAVGIALTGSRGAVEHEASVARSLAQERAAAPDAAAGPAGLAVDATVVGDAAAAPPVDSAPDLRPAAARRPQIAATGTLQISSLADGVLVSASIFVDGERIGETPLQQRVKPGKREVVARAPGYRPQRRTLRVRPGQRAKLVFVLSRATD